MNESEAHARLADLGIPAALRQALAGYCQNPYRALLAGGVLGLPLADEPHLAAWREYEAAAARDGAVPVLARALVQLRFPVRAGTSREARYQDATRRGIAPAGAGERLGLSDPAGIQVAVCATPAGAVPIVTARARADFVTLVRALAGRNEEVAVPDSMGACLIKGLINWDRVARHRARRERELGRALAPEEWQAEMGTLRAEPALYQDRVLLLSSGAYSAVAASEMGLDEAHWLERSLRLRRDHECFHYLTLRLFGRIRSNLFDELLADWVGLHGAGFGYRAEVALRFLGLARDGSVADSARLGLYRGDPPLPDQALAELPKLARAAAHNLERIAAGAAPDSPAVLLAVLGLDLDQLAHESALAAYARRYP